MLLSVRLGKTLSWASTWTCLVEEEAILNVPCANVNRLNCLLATVGLYESRNGCVDVLLIVVWVPVVILDTGI